MPCKIKKSKLKDNIKLCDSFDTSEDLAKGVMHISEPIVFDDIGILRTERLNEAPIYILQKINDK